MSKNIVEAVQNVVAFAKAEGMDNGETLNMLALAVTGFIVDSVVDDPDFTLEQRLRISAAAHAHATQIITLAAKEAVTFIQNNKGDDAA